MLQARIPIRATAVGCDIEQIPKRSNQADVSTILTAVARRKHQFLVAEVINPAAAADEHVEGGLRFSRLTLPKIISVVAVAS